MQMFRDFFGRVLDLEALEASIFDKDAHEELIFFLVLLYFYLFFGRRHRDNINVEFESNKLSDGWILECKVLVVFILDESLVTSVADKHGSNRVVSLIPLVPPPITIVLIRCRPNRSLALDRNGPIRFRVSFWFRIKSLQDYATGKNAGMTGEL